MITDAHRILALSRMVQDAEAAYDDAERELTAALADLDASHRREADLAAELIQSREVIDEQQQLIAAHQHTAVLAHQAYLVACAERDALAGRLVGGIALWVPAGSLN